MTRYPYIVVCLLAAALIGGCAEPSGPSPATQPAATQPDEAEPIVGDVGELDVAGDVAPEAAVPAPTMPAPAVGQPANLSGGPDGPAPEPPAVTAPPEPPPDLGVPVGLPDGVRVQFTLPGDGRQPARIDVPDQAARVLAARQAAVFAAIYNVTRELGGETAREEIPDGFVYTDRYRYPAGLTVDSRTTIKDGRARAFEIRLTVPAGGDGDELVVEVRNFVLAGGPVSGEKMRRIFAAAGRRLAVSKVEGPDDHQICHAEVAVLPER